MTQRLIVDLLFAIVFVGVGYYGGYRAGRKDSYEDAIRMADLAREAYDLGKGVRQKPVFPENIDVRTGLKPPPRDSGDYHTRRPRS